MNILVINGSPRMERSNSLRMTRAFLEGLAKTCDTQVEELTVAKMHIAVSYTHLTLPTTSRV